MARERLADLDESKEDERERKLKLQEKNRRAQQAFRWRQKSKIQELSDQVTELTTKNGSNIAQMQELQREKATLEEALAGQAAQLQRLTSEYMAMRARSVSNMFLPSSTFQFDPSEDVVLKYPASASDGCAEHVLLPSSDIQQGAGMERLRELMQEQWLPELKDLCKECDDVMEKKRANSHGSSRTKQARQEEANKALESIDERCKRIQRLYYECLVKILRAQPNRARHLIGDVLYNSNASLSPEEIQDKAAKVLDELDLSSAEIEQTCRMYEKFLCNMALLRWQREKMVEQVGAHYKLGDEDWLGMVTSEQRNLKGYLKASAAIESMYIWLRRETELYCDLITSVCLEIWRPTTFMRQITAAAPGMVDFLAMLEVLRARHKPQEKVLDITTAFTQSAITPRTMATATDGQMDAVASLRVNNTGAEPSPRSLVDLGLAATALPASVLAQATSGLSNPRLAVEAAREAEEMLSKAKNGGRDFWSGPGSEAGAAGEAVKKPKLAHEGSSPSSVLPKLERSQLLTLPPHASPNGGAAGVGAAAAFGGAAAAGASPPTAAQAGALLSLADPSAAVNVSSPIASATTSPMGCSGPVLPPLPLNNLNRNTADVSWLMHSNLTPREQEFTDFLSGMLSNRAPMPSPGRVSTIDILRVRSNSQVGEIELIQAQASIQQQAQAQGQGQNLQVGTGTDVMQQPQLQVNSLHLSGANSQLNRLAQEGLLGNLANALPQSNGQGTAAANTNVAASVAAFGQGKPGAQQSRARRTPEELAASYQAFMGEAL